MPNSQFHTAISSPRYLRYLNACGTRRKALKLYRANIVLSQKMFATIGILEVVLRNSIDRHMIATEGTNWLEDAANEGGYLTMDPGCEHSLRTVRQVIHNLGTNYNHDSLVASLPFGFWRYHFAPREYSASGNLLLNIFVNRPLGLGQTDIFHRITKVNETRNRIAHHEPICLYRNAISTAKIEKSYYIILELLEWLGCNPRRLLYGIDGVRKSIAVINDIQHSC